MYFPDLHGYSMEFEDKKELVFDLVHRLSRGNVDVGKSL